MNTGAAEILLTRPPAPGHERAAGPPSPKSAATSEARPGGQARPRQGHQAAHERASSGQRIIMRFRIDNGSNVPTKSLCASSVRFVSSVVGFVRRHSGRPLLIVTVDLALACRLDRQKYGPTGLPHPDASAHRRAPEPERHRQERGAGPGDDRCSRK